MKKGSKVSLDKESYATLKRKKSTSSLSSYNELYANKKKINRKVGNSGGRNNKEKNRKSKQNHKKSVSDENMQENVLNMNMNNKKLNDELDDNFDLTNLGGKSFLENVNNELLSTELNNAEKIDITEKLTNSFIYCREKEKEFILNFIKNQETKNLFICGQPGTGKTSLVVEILNSSLQEIEYAFKMQINCMSLKSVKEFFEEVFLFFNKTKNLFILKSLFGNNLKKFEEITNILKISSSNNLIKFFKILTEVNAVNTVAEESTGGARKVDNIRSAVIGGNPGKTVNAGNEGITVNKGTVGIKITPIIFLDEVDQFYQKNNDIIFYDILNIPYISGCNMKIIMISNNPEFDKDILPKIENRKIKIEKYVFQPYTHLEINKILSQKLQEINFIANFEENALRFISSKLANKSGDIRPALEIIKKLILTHKDEFSKGKKIDLKTALNLMSQQYSHFTEIIRDLTFEQKIVVISIYFVGMKLETNIIPEEDILKQYKLIKKENFNDGINMSIFYEVMKSLYDLGILTNLKNKNKKIIKIEPRMEDIELIFGEDEKLFSMFKSSN